MTLDASDYQWVPATDSCATHGACRCMSARLAKALDDVAELRAERDRVLAVVEARGREAAELARGPLLSDVTKAVPPVPSTPIRLTPSWTEQVRAAALRDVCADVRREVEA